MNLALPLEKQSLTGIDRLVALVGADMARVNAMILSRTGSDVAMIPEVAKHLINSGGKRLRPMLTLVAAQMFGYRGEGHIKLAAAVEFMHTATLLHDDVVDESDLRRGKAPGHADFPPDSEIQCEIRLDLIRVLEVGSAVAGARIEELLTALVVGHWSTQQEIGKVASCFRSVKREASVGSARIALVDLQITELSSKLHRVFSNDLGKSIRKMPGVVWLESR